MLRANIVFASIILALLGLMLLTHAVESEASSQKQTASSSSSSSSGSLHSTGTPTASSSTTSTSSGVSQARQSAVSLIGTLGSLVPGLISNVAPLVLLFGIGALMMPSLGLGAMGLLRESRRSSNEQPNLANVQLPAAFAQYARPLQTSPQDIYYFTKRSLPGIMSQINTQGILHGMQDILERVARAIDNADKRYN